MSPRRGADARRRAILALVARRRIATQEELAQALAARGFQASQASISRDIAALGLAKRDGRYVVPAEPSPHEDPLLTRLRECVLAIAESPPNLLVLTTPPGEASAAALALDQLALPGVAGTIAGDDTVFVALARGTRPAAAARRLRRLGLGRRE